MPRVPGLNRVRRAARELLGVPAPTGPLSEHPDHLEEQVFLAAVRPGDVCFDVGANDGQSARLFARLAGPAGRVFAFEPVWPVYERLCKALQADGPGSRPRATVVTIPAGLGEAERSATIQVPEDDFAMGSLASAETWASVLPGKTLVPYRCAIHTLDGFMKANQALPPDFLKIDVEGAELHVLRGAAGLFASGRRPLMHIELFAPWERAFGYGPWDVLAPLADLGYRFLFACPGGLLEHRPTPATPLPTEYEHGYNVIALCDAVHADRAAALERLRYGGEAARSLIVPPASCLNRIEIA